MNHFIALENAYRDSELVICYTVINLLSTQLQMIEMRTVWWQVEPSLKFQDTLDIGWDSGEAKAYKINE